ncbi:hypothetical protein SASPL_130612 [Salvia splendens]|uniref:Uncharacterized protein n=1 Tax=Salvia splendens TaxID=180675 RepID=A0A8X8X607_SALSN|nr:hypothetical protein SASPL_130612 [Salvia splendens]
MKRKLTAKFIRFRNRRAISLFQAEAAPIAAFTSSVSKPNPGEIQDKRSNVKELQLEEAEVTKSDVSSALRFSFPANDAMVKENQSSVGMQKARSYWRVLALTRFPAKNYQIPKLKMTIQLITAAYHSIPQRKQPKTMKMNTRLKKSDLHISSHWTSI